MGGWRIRYGHGCVDLGTEVTSASGGLSSSSEGSDHSSKASFP